ncbi:MAG: restriction endonuclease subunit S [Myxococcales bacterium]|nr:restriction endonuclease subunit S [Myxococcales bacterium]
MDGDFQVVEWSRGPALLNQRLCLLRANPRLEQRFLLYVLPTPLKLINDLTYFTTVKHLSSGQVLKIRVPLPPLPTQRAIAAFLDRKTAALDELVQAKEALRALLAEKRTALIHRAVTRGLNPDAPLKDSGIAWLGRIPAHWSVRRVKYVCQLETGHTPSRAEPDYWVDHECTIPWVSLNDTKTLKDADFISETTYRISPRGMANSSAHLVPAGTVVFTRDATIGLAAITTRPMALSQHIIGWVCGPEMLNHYLLRVMDTMSPELERLTLGATIRTIGMSAIRELATPVPPRGEQVAIAEWLDGQLQPVDEARDLLRQQIELLKEYRQALITAAVTGQLDVPAEAP